MCSYGTLYISTVDQIVTVATVSVYIVCMSSAIQSVVALSTGQERFRGLMPQFYRGAAVAIVMCDVTRLDTLQSTKVWKKQVDENVLQPNGQPIPAVLLINKVLKSICFIGPTENLPTHAYFTSDFKTTTISRINASFLV